MKDDEFRRRAHAALSDLDKGSRERGANSTQSVDVCVGCGYEVCAGERKGCHVGPLLAAGAEDEDRTFIARAECGCRYGRVGNATVWTRTRRCPAHEATELDRLPLDAIPAVAVGTDLPTPHVAPCCACCPDMLSLHGGACCRIGF